MPNFFRHVTCFCLAIWLAVGPNSAIAQENPQNPAPSYRLPPAAAIQVQPLPPTGPGLMTAVSVGLSDDLWQGQTYETWDVLLAKLPLTITTPTLRTLAAQALLSNATTPTGDVSPAAETNTRLGGLLPFVSLKDYQEFIATIPVSQRSTLITTYLQDLNFAENGPAACATLPNDSAIITDMLWQLYCTLADKNNPNRAAAAQLQLDLLRERGEQTGDVVALVDTILANYDTPDASLDPATINASSVLKMRLLGTLENQPLPKAQLTLPQRAALFIKLERGGDEGATAAEQLADSGLITAATLRDSYSAVAFTETERTDANILNQLPAPKRRALIWQQISDADDERDTLRLLNDFINAGGVPALLGARGEILLPVLQGLSASTETAWAAPAMFALAAAQDDVATAAAWRDAMLQVADTLPAAQAWLARLWPLALALQLDGVAADRLPIWVATTQAQVSAEDVVTRVPVADTLTILEAAGFAVPQQLWAQVTDTPTLMRPGQVDLQQVEALQTAANANQQGAVILRVIVTTGGNVQDMPPSINGQIIRALANVELPTAARQLTVEALLSVLFPSAK